MEFDEVVEVAFSFRKLVKIDNLHGLDKLTKLKLDNNRITTIENLSHLVRALPPNSMLQASSVADL